MVANHCFIAFLSQHYAGVTCLTLLKSSLPGGCDYIFTGSRDGTLKRWALAEDGAACCATFESHVYWVQSKFVFLASSCVVLAI